MQKVNKPAKLPKQKGRLLSYLRDNYDLYLFLVPAVLVVVLFMYWPIYGVQIAFRDFKPKLGFFDSTWVGLKHFERLFNSTYFMVVLKNTLIVSAYQLAASFPIPIIFALMLNAMKGKRYRKLIQTVTYAPNFISTVVLCGMVVLFLSPRVGVFNLIIEFLGGEKTNFMAFPQYWSSIYVWSGIWQTLGWNSIIYFAALASVSPELHEAATMDGASKFQRVLHVDLPSIMPTITILLILSFGSLMSIGFEKAYLLQNDANLAASEMISTYVYKMAFGGGLVSTITDLSFSTAVGLFNSVVNLVLLFSVNFIAGKISDNSLF